MSYQFVKDVNANLHLILLCELSWVTRLITVSNFPLYGQDILRGSTFLHSIYTLLTANSNPCL